MATATATRAKADDAVTAGGRKFQRETPAPEPALVAADGNAAAHAGGEARQRRPMARGSEVTIGGRVFTRESGAAVQSAASPYEAITREMWPDGVTYQWKRESTAGQADESYMSGLRRLGWQFVPADRHPGYVVRHEGLVLMEIPTVWLEEFNARDRRLAAAERFNKADFDPDRVKGFERRAGRGGLDGGRHERMEAVDPSLLPELPRSIDE